MQNGLKKAEHFCHPDGSLRARKPANDRSDRAIFWRHLDARPAASSRIRNAGEGGGISEPSVKTTAGHPAGSPRQSLQTCAGGDAAARSNPAGRCGAPTPTSKPSSATQGRRRVPREKTGPRSFVNSSGIGCSSSPSRAHLLTASNLEQTCPMRSPSQPRARQGALLVFWLS